MLPAAPRPPAPGGPFRNMCPVRARAHRYDASAVGSSAARGATLQIEPVAFSSVLVVEDDPATRQRTCRLVGEVGGAAARCVVAADLASARALALEPGGHTLALVDVQLPDGNGIDFIDWLRRHRPALPAVVVSSWAEDQTILAALRAGAIGYLLKNSEDVELAMSLRSLQRGGAPIDPVIARRILDMVPRAPVAAASAPAPDPAIRLSPRETEILTLVSRGLSNREIADATRLSRLTIECHTRNIYRKLSVNSRTGAVFEAQVLGLLQ